jgi:hypothetical protein
MKVDRLLRNDVGGVDWSCIRGKWFAQMLVASLLLVASVYGQSQPPSPPEDAFPEMDSLVPRVAQHQKELEKLLTQYTFTDKTTVYTLDKRGQVRSQHADTYYITPTPYEVFVLHVAHDGKPVSESNLNKQQREIEHKIRMYEKKEQKQGELQPKDSLLFGDIILKSKFTPLRWEEKNGQRLLVCSFEPKSQRPQGDLNSRIAGDMRGKMWISPEDAEIVRMDFTSVSPINLGGGFLGNVKGFDGFVEQQKVHGEAWLPLHQEFVANGREIVKGFRIRQVSDFSEYLKATTDVFQQIHNPSSAARDSVQAPQ